MASQPSQSPPGERNEVRGFWDYLRSPLTSWMKVWGSLQESRCVYSRSQLIECACQVSVSFPSLELGYRSSDSYRIWSPMTLMIRWVWRKRVFTKVFGLYGVILSYLDWPTADLIEVGLWTNQNRAFPHKGVWRHFKAFDGLHIFNEV